LSVNTILRRFQYEDSLERVRTDKGGTAPTALAVSLLLEIGNARCGLIENVKGTLRNIAVDAQSQL